MSPGRAGPQWVLCAPKVPPVGGGDTGLTPFSLNSFQGDELPQLTCHLAFHLPVALRSPLTLRTMAAWVPVIGPGRAALREAPWGPSSNKPWLPVSSKGRAKAPCPHARPRSQGHQLSDTEPLGLTELGRQALFLEMDADHSLGANTLNKKLNKVRFSLLRLR